ncbi:MAG: phosphoenolpyruvate--protein phosphotransferase [Candidatus Muiribacteriaceae bacterium]
MKFKGIPVSDGIAVGKCRVLKDTISDTEMYSVSNVDREQERFKNAVIEVKKEIFSTIEEIDNGKSLEGIDSDVFRAHIRMLEDPVFYRKVHEKIRLDNKNVEWSVNEVIKELVAVFESTENEVMRDRAADIKDIGMRLLSSLRFKDNESLKDLDGVIIIAEELTPTQLLHLANEGVSGICTEKGGLTSHVAIFSRSLELPAVTGVHHIVDYLSDGDYVVIDTEESEILFNLTEKELNQYLFLKRQHDRMMKARKKTRDLESVTKDGERLTLAGNIQIYEDIIKLKEYGISNVGLYRTEFMFMDRDDIPSEDEQYEYYKKIGESVDGDYVVIRTLDAGGDKNVKSVNDVRMENNPFLGWRGIRICLDRIDIFKTQLRAILRAAHHADIKILYPMVSSCSQYEAICKIMDEVKQELRDEGVDFCEDIDEGILIEVPSAIMYMDYFAEKVDFFSVGTNDLLQFLLAVDRTNYKISSMYSWYDRALFNILKYIVRKAHAHGKKVQVCGEIASDPLCLPVMIGLGIHNLSMVPGAVPKIKLLTRSVFVEECKEIADCVLEMNRNSEIKEFLSNKFKEFMGREEVINEMSEMWKGK